MKTMKYALAALVVTAVGAQAALITGVSASATTEMNGSGLYRPASALVDGSGLSGAGAATDTHSTTPDSDMWFTPGTIGYAGPADADPAVTFDLGAVYDVGLMRIWNYNESGGNGDGTYNWTQHGVDEVLVSAGATLGSLTQTMTINVAEASGTAAETGQDFLPSFTGVQFIKFTVVSNHDGDNYVTDVYNTSVDGTQFTGLSEVRFDTIPEPATLGLLTIFGGATLIIRRRLMI